MARRTRTFKAQIRRTKTLNRQVEVAIYQGPKGVGRGTVRVSGCEQIRNVETTEDLQKGRPVIKVGSAIIAGGGPRPGPTSSYALSVVAPGAGPPPLVFPGGPGGAVQFLLWFKSGDESGAAGYAYNAGSGEVEYLGAFGSVIAGEPRIGRGIFLDNSIDGDRSFVDVDGNMRRLRYSTGATASFGASPGWALGPGANRWLEVQLVSAASTTARPAQAFNFDASDYTVLTPSDPITSGVSEQWAPVSCRGGNHTGGSATHFIFVRQGDTRWIPKGIQPGGLPIAQGATITQDFYSSPRPPIGVDATNPFDEIVETEEYEDGVEYQLLRRSLPNGDLDTAPDFFSTHPDGLQMALDGCKTSLIDGTRVWILRAGRIFDRWSGSTGATGTHQGTAPIVGGPDGDPVGCAFAVNTTLPPS